MITETVLFFQFGIIMLLAFIGAGLAARFGQSVILGYIAIGALIGPYMSITLFGFTYNGLIQNTETVSYFAKMGLILLLFFVGLEFSVSKLKKTRTAATILAIFNFGIDMFLGILLGVLMRWPLEDSFFLAAIIGTGSSAVAAKTLMEIGKLTAPETDFIIGMSVVEDFIAMLLLTVAGGLTMTAGNAPASLWALLSGIGIFYMFFLLLAVFVIPRVVKHLDVIRSDEMFILFALGIVFISAALADALYVQSLIGAFFIGMVFAETSMTDRLKTKLMSMRDAFVAIFFVYFGMMMNPSVMIMVLPMVAFAVPLMLLSDIIITTSVAMLIGFPSRHAFFVGSTSAFRGAESMLFASVGGSSLGVTYAEQLYAIAGPFSLIMDLVALPVLKNSSKLVVKLSKYVPTYVRFCSLLISRTFSKLVMPQPLKIYGDAKRSTLPLWSFIISCAVAIFVSFPFKLIPIGVALVSAYMSVRVLRKDLNSAISLINYANIGVPSSKGIPEILDLVIRLVSGLMITTVAVIAVSAVYIPASLGPIALYVLLMLHSMKSSYSALSRFTPLSSRTMGSRGLPRQESAGGFGIESPTVPFHNAGFRQGISLASRYSDKGGVGYIMTKPKVQKAKEFHDGIFPPPLK